MIFPHVFAYHYLEDDDDNFDELMVIEIIGFGLGFIDDDEGDHDYGADDGVDDVEYGDEDEDEEEIGL